MEPVIVIEKPADFDALIEEVAQTRYLAVDTEANSFYVYFDRVCLIQISTTEKDYIVDPFAIKEMHRLGDIFDDPGIEKIFHAASNDILGFKRDFQFSFRNLFDTAVACKLLGYKQLGLAKILEEHFGVTLDKKWQRHDWGQRPLHPQQLNYARLDTHYLIPLRHRLASELVEQGLWEIALEACNKVCDQEFQEKTFHAEAFIQIHGAQTLDPTGKRILKALFLYREHEARRRNRAPFRILSNETLLRLASHRPKDLDDFSKIKGLPRTYHNGRAAHNLLDLIRKTEDFCEELALKQ